MLSFVRKKAVSFSGTWIPVPRVEREFSENHASTAPAFFRRDRSRLPESAVSYTHLTLPTILLV